MALWTPDKISGLTTWLSSADASTITIDTGVSNWTGKGGTTNNATQATAGSQPERVTAEINGRDVLRFNGSKRMTFSSAVIPVTHSLFVVFKPTIEATIRALLGQWQSGQTGRFYLGMNQNSVGATASGRFNPYNSTTTAGAGSAGFAADFAITAKPTLFESICTTGAENWKMYKDGTETDSATITALYQGINTNIGAEGGTGTALDLYNGDFCELIIYDRVLNDSERELVEGYATHGWGFEADLAADHRFKVAPPTTFVYYGTARDKSGVLAAGRGVRAIREADQACVASVITGGSGAYNTGLFLPYNAGTVTTASASVITDSAQAWTVDEFATHYGVRMTSGAQSGQWRRIVSNTATALTLASDLPGTTAVDDTFEIAALHTLVFSGESDRNALVYSGLMPKDSA